MFLAGSAAVAGPVQSGRQTRGAPPPAVSASSGVSDAYDQYLLGLRLERDDNIEGAIAAYKRAMTLDPSAADVPAELAALYMRQNRIGEAMTAAEQALKVAPDNLEAHRVLGTIYAALSEADTRTGRGGRPVVRSDENATKAIEHLEQAIRRPAGEPDPNLLANLSRLYVRTGAYNKGDPDAARPRGPGARMAGRRHPAGRRLRRRRQERRGDCLAGRGVPTIPGCTRRSAISTIANAAGRIRPARTRWPFSARRATSP